MNRNIDERGPGLGIERADVIEVCILALADAAAGVALARESVVQIVDEIGEIFQVSPTTNPLLLSQMVALAGCPGNCGTPKLLSFCRLPLAKSQLRCVGM